MHVYIVDNVLVPNKHTFVGLGVDSDRDNEVDISLASKNLVQSYQYPCCNICFNLDMTLTAMTAKHLENLFLKLKK